MTELVVLPGPAVVAERSALTRLAWIHGSAEAAGPVGVVEPVKLTGSAAWVKSASGLRSR